MVSNTGSDRIGSDPLKCSGSDGSPELSLYQELCKRRLRKAGVKFRRFEAIPGAFPRGFNAVLEVSKRLEVFQTQFETLRNALKLPKPH